MLKPEEQMYYSSLGLVRKFLQKIYPSRLISIEDENGYDRVGLRLRLAAEVPAAVLDDHYKVARTSD